jgi:hypothetical protein
MLIYEDKGVKAELSSGDLILTYGDVGSEVSVKVKLEYLLTKAVEQTENKIDDAIAATFISALKAIS